MPHGGTLPARLQALEHRWIIAFPAPAVGISPHEAEKIFEPFQSHFEGGTGFGLAIVYQIVQAHGANISVHSTPQNGADFVLEIPKAVTQTARAAVPIDARSSRGAAAPELPKSQVAHG